MLFWVDFKITVFIFPSRQGQRARCSREERLVMIERTREFEDEGEMSSEDIDKVLDEGMCKIMDEVDREEEI